MKRQILIIKYERKLATTSNAIKTILYKTILKILNSKIFDREKLVVDNEFWNDEVEEEDIEEDLEKKYYKWS